MNAPTIVLAGAAGDLGTRIAKALVSRGAAVRALVRNDASDADKNRLATIGAKIASADVNDIGSVAAGCEGASCVVSALNGLHDVVVVRQGMLLDAAVKSGVPRFISSDYSLDFTKTTPGGNRNLDLRREFMTRADRAPIKVTSILNGAFMDMLGAEMPIIRRRLRRLLYWGNADQSLDFTTKDDTAASTPPPPRSTTRPENAANRRDTVSARGIAGVMSDITADSTRRCSMGGTGSIASADSAGQGRRSAASRGVSAVAKACKYIA